MSDTVPLKAGCDETGIHPLTKRCLNPLCNLSLDMHVFDLYDEVLLNGFLHNYIDNLKHSFLPLLQESSNIYLETSKQYRTVWACQFTSVYEMQHRPKITLVPEPVLLKIEGEDPYIRDILIPKLSAVRPTEDIVVWVRIDLHTKPEDDGDEDKENTACFQSSAVLSREGVTRYLEEMKAKEQREWHSAVA